MINPLGIGFFDATFVVKAPGAPPKKKVWPDRITGRCIFDSARCWAFHPNRTLAMVNPLGLRFLGGILVTTVSGVSKKNFGKIRPRNMDF